MACMLGELPEVQKLGSPISFAKWMSVIDITDDLSGTFGKIGLAEVG
jgi:hypothetical protein